jgi:uncharacterized protein YaiE (UPF0345 family)
VRVILATVAAATCALSGQAAAERFSQDAVTLQHVAAVLEVIPEDRTDVDVAIGQSERLPAISARVEGDRVVIDGGLRNRFRGCTSMFGGQPQVRISGIGGVAREDLPRVTVRVPRTLDLNVGGAVFTNVRASQGGVVNFNGCGDAQMAAVSGALDVDLNGSGDVNVASVGGALNAALNGSGSLDVVRAGGDAVLRLNGSGDLDVGDVTGAVDARLNGSGSLEVGAAGNGARLALNGSGDVDAGAVRGALNVDLRGSGSVEVASVEGASAELSLLSSGDIHVVRGQVGALVARSEGAGSVRYGGSAETTRASVSGSGDVSIADAGRVEELRDRGSGSVNVGR